MSETSYNLCIIKLHCYRQDESKADEIFICYKGKKIWPPDEKYTSITVGEYPLKLKIPAIAHDENIILELWDYDFLLPNNKLGTFNMLINEKGGPYRTDLSHEKGRSAKYTLEWEVD